MFVEVLLNVLAIIGIIIAGGFLIFFLGDLVISIVDGKNSSVFGGKSKNNHPTQDRPMMMNPDYNQQQQPTATPYYYTKETPKEAKPGTLEFAQPKQEAPLMNKGWQEVDEEQARIERMMLENSNKPEVSAVKQENHSSIEQLRKEEEEFKKKSLQDLEKRQVENPYAKPATVKESKNDEVLDFGDLFFDDNNETNDEEDVDFEALLAELTSKAEKTEPTKEMEDFLTKQDSEEDILASFMRDEEDETPVVEEAAEEEEEVEEELIVADATDKVREELETLRQMLAEKEVEAAALKEKTNQEIQQAKADLEKMKLELEQAKQTKEVVVEEVLLSEEEYQDLIERLSLRLKTNERELKKVKREYLPLARVKKSLENDKKKLRRKEATVAKQKVILYGVNNYVDIDEEKAKELAEDLDLLDGLKLSVEHCETVMEQNKERYPLLENTYRILKESNDELKKDIQEMTEKLEKVRLSKKD